MSLPRLGRRLVLEAVERVPDGAGGFTQSWTALGTLWAEVTARSGRERAEVGQTLSMVSYRIVLRAAPVGSNARPEPGQRLREGTRAFRVRAVHERDPVGRYLVCHAEEEVAV